MNRQRGFIVLVGPAFLAMAAVIGGAATVDYATKDKTPEVNAATTTTQTPVAQTATTPAFIGTSYTDAPYDGNLYRNGGYFGDQNSDYSLENGGN